MGFTIGKLTSLYLGQQYENNSRTIDIDVSKWLNSFPGATISVLIRRPGEKEPYEPDCMLADGHLTWKPKRKELEIEGRGQAQFVLIYNGDTEKRSRIIETVIGKSLMGSIGEDDTSGVILYTADGEIFIDANGAVMYLQEGDSNGNI